ncbi:MAG: SDR family oxidoreductase [Lachnospiraceae bacterium]|nr:SDR family oxidoreductase [Lachnospiraceae bacterium]
MYTDKRVIVVTGATAGIGEAISLEFADKNSVVVLLGRNEHKGNCVKEKILGLGPQAEFIKTDVTSEEQLTNVYDILADRYGKIDVLVNNAGIMLESKELERLPKEEWEKTFDVNIKAAYMVISHLKELVFNVKGTIINIGSVAGMHSYVAGRSYAYSASKAALIQFSRQMALNYASEGVRVNCVCPGIIDTDILGNRNRDEYAKRVPIGYIGAPSDIAKVVYFLASSEASYITGAVIPVDGGVSLN